MRRLTTLVFCLLVGGLIVVAAGLAGNGAPSGHCSLTSIGVSNPKATDN
jgi:hypothetical protein